MKLGHKLINRILYSLALIFISVSCENIDDQKIIELDSSTENSHRIVVLGTTQDAGAPHIACKKSCCVALFDEPNKDFMVVSLGLIDPIEEKTYLFEATPDISRQAKALKQASGFDAKETPDGIFLSHAHIGHYSGLMYLGKEAMGAKQVPVYAMPRMKLYLENNGPWSQLVEQENIKIQAILNQEEYHLGPKLSIIPIIVPHRDEFSETVGYRIIGPAKQALFIPDIDKWEKWDHDIIEEIKNIDYAFIDATFYDGDELNNRAMSEIPHPFIIESIKLFESLSSEEKKENIFHSL